MNALILLVVHDAEVDLGGGVSWSLERRMTW